MLNRCDASLPNVSPPGLPNRRLGQSAPVSAASPAHGPHGAAASAPRHARRGAGARDAAREVLQQVRAPLEHQPGRPLEPLLPEPPRQQPQLRQRLALLHASAAAAACATAATTCPATAPDGHGECPVHAGRTGGQGPSGRAVRVHGHEPRDGAVPPEPRGFQVPGAPATGAAAAATAAATAAAATGRPGTEHRTRAQGRRGRL